MADTYLFQYRTINRFLIILFICIFLCPIVITYAGLQIKSCSGHCSTCGITRDFYKILTLENYSKMNNYRSIPLMKIIITYIVFRAFIELNLWRNYFKTTPVDIALSIMTFLSIFLLLNKS